MSNEPTVFQYNVELTHRAETYEVRGIAQVGDKPLVSLVVEGLSLVEAMLWLDHRATTIDECGEYVWSGDLTDCAGQLLTQAKFTFWQIEDKLTPEERLELVPYEDHLLKDVNPVSFIQMCLGYAHRFGSPVPLNQAPVGLQLYLQKA